jgi:hypothetical protein
MSGIGPGAQTGNQLAGSKQLRRPGEDRCSLIQGLILVPCRDVAVSPRRRDQGLASIRQHDQQFVAPESAHRPNHLQPPAR